MWFQIIVFSGNSTSGFVAKRIESRVLKRYCTPRFIAALFTIAKRWKQPKCSPMDEWINKMCYIQTMEYSSALKKGNSGTCYSMDVWGHYTKRNKPVTKRQRLYNSTYLYKVFRAVRLIEIESRRVVAKSWGEGKMGSCCLMGTEFPFCKMKSF